MIIGGLFCIVRGVMLKREYFTRLKHLGSVYIVFLVLLLCGGLLRKYRRLERGYILNNKKSVSINGDILKILISEHKDAATILALVFPYIFVERFCIRSIEEEGIRDSLTGLYLRRKVEAIIPVIKKNPGTKWTILYVDLDGLKKINDTRGHKAGDEYIVNFTKVINSVIRKDDYFLRMGGDEFLILLKDVEEESRFSIIQRFYDLREKQDIEFSMGTVLFKGKETFKKKDLDSLILKADDRMYKDKHFRKSQNLG